MSVTIRRHLVGDEKYYHYTNRTWHRPKDLNPDKLFWRQTSYHWTRPICADTWRKGVLVSSLPLSSYKGIHILINLVHMVGLEPTWLYQPRVFKTLASTYFATRAMVGNIGFGPMTSSSQMRRDTKLR